ncbi:MAG: DUF4185 domain-containing protein [Chloroflexota bacterium]|nr:MAG: hypothetical protein UZ13_01449 [Chloroflexi bacterium OLB13]MDL1916886.1 DUF4185 domain-containing protein [Anaerolineae bacterium CFX4]MEB2365647.1 DUF4185 domain-containing protein [Chloroflexota bacterium]GIK27298.1 MAG: hypothetical protein BroJett007_04360 [Chloroflexota bacterium]
MTRFLKIGGMAAVLLVLFSFAGAQNDTPDTEPVLVGIEDVEFVAWLTGPESENATDVNYDIDGTDLGSMFEMDGTLYIAFGDTFGCCRPSGGGAGGRNWRTNALAYTTDRNVEDGITFDGMIVDKGGRARNVLKKRFADVTIIPTDGIAIDGRMYLHYMAVKSWDEPGHWTLNRSGWGYSDDGGETWTQPPEAVWDGDTNFGQAALVERDGYLYVFGIHGGRYGGVALARTPVDSVLDMAAYTYWDGADWVSDINAAVEIVPAPVGELSVKWNDFLGRWIMTYLDEPRRGNVIREAPTLMGPWSEPLMLVSAADYPSLYGAYLNPWASDGEVIYFNMSQWGPYNVMVMRARLVKAE